MREILASILQGIVEGLTEFLPVSSTAHILLTQELFGLDREDPFWKMFAVFIQLGAIIAVVVYFRQRLLDFVASFYAAWKSRKQLDPEDESNDHVGLEDHLIRRWYHHPLCLVLLSFVVTAVPCFVIDNMVGEYFEKLYYIGWALIVGGVVMVAVDWIFASSATTTRMEDMTTRQAIAIGSFQILAAAFPGTSRSMSTIAAGQLFGLSRATALEFSFFLAIPVMFAAAGFKLLKHLLKESIPDVSQWINLAVGFTTSFIVAYFVIAWFMHWVRSKGFLPFAIYRIAIGVAILWWFR